MMRPSTARPCYRLAILFTVLVSASFAQNSRGTLRGTIQDATGGRIAAAKIVVQSDGIVQRELSSDVEGEFHITGLLPGSYQLTISAQGFSPASAKVPVEVSSIRDIAVTLRPASSIETVSVVEKFSSITTQPIDLASAVHQTVVSEHDLGTLPLAARSFANIAYLAPGTEPVEPSDPTKARITAVSTGGSSGLNNELSVDGGDNSDDYIGGFLQNFSVDSIQEFAVRTAQSDADTEGRPLGPSLSPPSGAAMNGMEWERFMTARHR
jgi:hypothetical protein